MYIYNPGGEKRRKKTKYLIYHQANQSRVSKREFVKCLPFRMKQNLNNLEMEMGLVEEGGEWNPNPFSQHFFFLCHVLAKTLCSRNWPEARVSLYLSCVSEILGLDPTFQPSSRDSWESPEACLRPGPMAVIDDSKCERWHTVKSDWGTKS